MQCVVAYRPGLHPVLVANTACLHQSECIFKMHGGVDQLLLVEIPVMYLEDAFALVDAW
jgi:hypothetical protein